ncbi:hypothetical protein DVH24_004171 [Malus domestica]|uniref:Uncharacterized protein n=1 Tax=Malus domestica TaxID=3750 RepID=A0A498K5I9_MALDO|nr:hypothetical protein DVH24_004171 [Malus domestica]
MGYALCENSLNDPTVKLVCIYFEIAYAKNCKNKHSKINFVSLLDLRLFAIFGICDFEAYTNKFDGWIFKTSFIQCV